MFTGAPPRDPRFDPLAMPVTTATRLDDLVAGPGLLPEGFLPSDAPPSTPRKRRRQRSSALLWGAAGVLLIAVVAIVVVASLQ
jgi:hypothetical protein